MFSSLDAMGWYRHMLNRLAIDHGTDLSIPYKDQPEKFRDELLHGTGTRKIQYTYKSRAGRVSYMNHTFEGVIPNLERRWGETNSDYIKEKISELMTEDTCPVCKGRKLKDTVLAVTVGGLNIMEICDLSVMQAMDFFEKLDSELTDREKKISAMITKEIKASWISYTEPHVGDPVRRRVAAYTPRDADRLGSRRSPLHTRRAVHRPSSGRQQQTAGVAPRPY